MKYHDECAIDTGGVARDMLCVFWEKAYSKMFDGGNLFIPAVHHQVEMDKFPTLGAIISHGYLSCGFLPMRIVFPVLAAVLLGPSTKISDKVVVESFLDSLVSYDAEVFKEAFTSLKVKPFDRELECKLINLMSRFGCRDTPTPNNFKRLVIEISRHELNVKAVGAVYAMNEGLPHNHRDFWESYGVERLYLLYKALSATCDEVLKMITEPDDMNSSQERVYGYL